MEIDNSLTDRGSDRRAGKSAGEVKESRAGGGTGAGGGLFVEDFHLRPDPARRCAR